MIIYVLTYRSAVMRSVEMYHVKENRWAYPAILGNILHYVSSYIYDKVI